MSRIDSFDWTPRADVAFQRLPESVQTRIESALSKIKQIGPRSPYVAKIRGQHNMYIVRAGKDMRVIFQLEDNIAMIADIVQADKLHTLAHLYAPTREL